MKKQFTNPTPIEPEQKKIKKITENDIIEAMSMPEGYYTPKLLLTIITRFNELVDILNTHYSKDVRGGKFGGKII